MISRAVTSCPEKHDREHTAALKQGEHRPGPGNAPARQEAGRQPSPKFVAERMRACVDAANEANHEPNQEKSEARRALEQWGLDG